MIVRYQILARELRRLGRLDQVQRRAFKPGMPWDDTADRWRASWLKAIVRRHGWPTIGKVGTTAHRAAWLIVQHAGFDPKFQALALRKMREAYRHNRNNIELAHIAYLTDRILAQKGKQQLYGTQLSVTKTGKVRPLPIQDRRRLDARRKSMGLNSFATYIQSARKDAQ